MRTPVDELGEVLTAIGTMWRSGDMSIATEHEITELLGRALAQCASTIPESRKSVYRPHPGIPPLGSLFSKSASGRWATGLGGWELGLR